MNHSIVHPMKVLTLLAPLVFLPATTPAGTQDERSLGPAPIEITPAQRRAVDQGLAWLAEHQNPDGSWSAKIGYKLNESYRETGDGSHVGVSAMAGMAFLAGGHLPGRGKYGRNVELGVNYILSACQKDGYITQNGTRMYSHAFATLFLAEIFGMTSRKDVRDKLQRAVDFIVDTQNAEGGWRYVPFDPTSDMSIVVCQVLALRAARNIGIRVPRSTVDRATQYVMDSAITEDMVRGFLRSRFEDPVGSFRYQVSRGVRSRSSFALTAAGVTSLYGLGIYSNEAILRGLDYLKHNLEEFNAQTGARRGGHYFFWYGHYYGVQAMYTAGSSAHIDYWEPYFERVRAELLSMQHADGSFPNDVGPGLAFGTATAVLILEIPYRYLPIFQR